MPVNKFCLELKKELKLVKKVRYKMWSDHKNKPINAEFILTLF
jgi:hypothetical protein